MKENNNIYLMNLRVTFYARVSTEQESQSSSITNQSNYFKKLINSIPNWYYIPGYIDEGISGKNTQKRENFLKMIEDGLNKKYDLILTKSVSRFARNTIDSIHYTDILKQNNIAVYFLNDNINTLNPDSEFRLTLMASIAQDEIRKLSESVKFGLNESINRGVVLGNSNILGYQKNKGRLIINKEEAKIVKDIYLLFSKNSYSYHSLAKIINKKYHKNYDSTGIKRILTNIKYKGYYCGKKTTVIDYKTNKRKNINKDNWIVYKDNKNIPPIIEEKLWNKVAEIIKNKTIKRKEYNVICSIHNKKYKYIKKRYKNKQYKYLSCPKCSSININLIDKLYKIHNIENITVYKYSDYILLKIKLLVSPKY